MGAEKRPEYHFDPWAAGFPRLWCNSRGLPVGLKQGLQRADTCFRCLPNCPLMPSLGNGICPFVLHLLPHGARRVARPCDAKIRVAT